MLTTDLEDTTIVLDFRVTALEENGGSDGNSSVAELEVRVETLEGTAADHETRISATEVDINGEYFSIIASTGISKSVNLIHKSPLDRISGNILFLDLEDVTADHETRLMTAEENIQGKLSYFFQNLLLI